MKSLKRQVLMRKIRLSVGELCKGVLLAGFLAFFFYRSVWAFVPMLIPAGGYILWEQKKEKDKKKRILRQQFSECILSVAGSVKAGYAAENAFVESIKDMEMMYGEQAEILEELKQIKGGLASHFSLAGVIQMTAREISDKIMLEDEIRTTLAAKRLEQKIMNGIPFLLVLYLEFTTPGYFDMFFREFSGIAIMTLFLIWYIAAYGLSEYILWRLEGG